MNVCLSVCPSGCLSGAFGPFCRLCLTHNHFETLPGHAGHHMDQFLSPLLSSSPYDVPDRHFFGEHKFLIVDISETSCRIVTKFCTVRGLANGNLFPEFGELCSLGLWTSLGCILSEIMNVCLSAHPDVCPGLLAHLTDFVWLTITFKHCLGMLATMWTRLCHHPCPAVCVRGRTDTFLDRLGCLFGAFCPSPHSGAAVCAIQPWADSSLTCFNHKLHSLSSPNCDRDKCAHWCHLKIF